MSWVRFAERLENSDFSGAPRVYQPFTIPRDLKLKAIRTWFVIYNNPTFTTLSMEIRANQSNLPTETIYTFDKTWVLADLLTTDPYGIKEIYFDFTVAKSLKADTRYYMVPRVTGASFSPAAHLSWVRGYPDPNTTSAVAVTPINIGRVPYYLALIGDDR